MTNTTPAPLLARGLHKRYGTRSILTDVSLELTRGEAVVLRGPNGTGKSTLLGCICGDVVPDAGDIAIAGHDLRTQPREARAALRSLAQETELPAGLTGREWLAFHATVFGAAAPADADIDPQLRAVIDQFASTYSVGLRRRLAFAGLMFGTAALFVLDEPFAGVDVDGRARMVEQLRARQDAGAAVLLAAHDHELGDIAALSPRVMALG